MSAIRIERNNLESLFTALKQEGYKIIAPKLSQETLKYTEVESASDLPQGYSDTQGAGLYKLTKNAGNALFAYNNSFDSIKKLLLNRPKKLWQANKEGSSFKITENPTPTTKYAFIGVRPCDIAALKELDKVFINGEFKDKDYETLRQNSLIIAVNCSTAAYNCFCTSMDTGPEASFGFDIALTEILKEQEHFFLASSGSDKGEALFEQLPHSKATESDLNKAKQVSDRTRKQVSKTLDTEGIKEIFSQSYESDTWHKVAEKCLACANCTLVCPTCFCSTVEDKTDLSGETAERWQYWDSCFSIDFSYIHGGEVRHSIKSRYRQWISHKLATWYDQFDSSGCVGCGRCITWCPVGIDITEEAKKLREEANSNDSI